MSTPGKAIIQALTLCQLLAVSWNLAAEDVESTPVSAAEFTAPERASIAESGDGGTAQLNNAETLPFLVSGAVWPLLGGVLVLAAVNSRKRPVWRRRW